MRVLIIGAGRAAFHLGHGTRKAGHELVGVAGREPAKAAMLARELGCASFVLGRELPSSDAILVAVSDDAIPSAAHQLPQHGAVVIHTSGAGELDRLLPHPDRAVLWPVISLSPGGPMDLSKVPLVVDANTDRARTTVKTLANSMSDQVHELVHAQRELVHAAAAISLNFPAHLLARAQGLLQDQDIDPAILTPSFVAMAQKAAGIGASEALTGPARRGDLGTIHRHLDRLTPDPELRAAYALLSSMILRAHGHPDHEHGDL